jgi:hypothetical protein
MTGNPAQAPRTISSDITEEAGALGAAVLDQQIAARLLGGLAVWLRCPSVRTGRFARSYGDMDFAVSKADAARLRVMFEDRGYLPDKFFNGLHGATRLYYAAPDGRWSIDVVIDELKMSHNLDLRGRLSGPRPSVSLADLLLTKLQVFEITGKDLGDALCLLADHGVAESDGDADAISLPRLTSVLGADWGFCHTVEGNLGKVAELWRLVPMTGVTCDVSGQVQAIQAAIAAAPKSRAWKLRSRIGERIRWYETPEEVRH